MLLKEEDLMQQNNSAATKTGRLTLTEEPAKDGQLFLWIRLDGEIVKCFHPDQEREAEQFFATFKPTKNVRVISERFLDEDEAPIPAPAKMERGTTLIVYRGVRITDKPHNGTPYTIIHNGMEIPHQDEETLPEMFDSIDEMLYDYQLNDEQAFVEPIPAWRKDRKATGPAI